MKCDHEALRNGDEIEDVEWRVKGYRGWTRVAYCNGDLVCVVTMSKVTDGIKVLGIAKGTLAIKRTTRNATRSHVDFKCEIHNGSHTLKHHVKIKPGECKSDFRYPRFLGSGGAIPAHCDFHLKQGNIIKSGEGPLVITPKQGQERAMCAKQSIYMYKVFTFSSKKEYLIGWEVYDYT